MTSSTPKTNYLQSSLFPSGQTISKSSRNVTGFNVETSKTETSLPPGYKTKLLVITRNEETEIEELQFVEKYDDVPYNSSLSVLLFFKDDVTDKELEEIVGEKVGEFIHTFVTTESSNDIPFFEESILKENLINECDPVNISSLKTIEISDPLIVNFTIITIFYDPNATGSKFSYYCHDDEGDSDDYDEKISNEGSLYWSFAHPKIFDDETGEIHDSYDPEIVAKNLMKKVESSSTPGRYVLKKMIERPKAKEYTNLGSATGHSPSQSSSSSSELYAEHVKKIGDKPDSSINSFEGVKNVLKKMSNIYKDMKKGVNNDSTTRKAIDMFKKSSKDQLLKASAGTNFKLSFHSFPNFLNDVPTMVFDDVERYDANFFVTITSTDFTSIAKSMNLSSISKDEKRSILIAVVKRFVEMVFELYDTQEITDEKYEDIFLNGNIVSSSSRASVGTNEFNEPSKKIGALKNLASNKSNLLKQNAKTSGGINTMNSNFGFQNKIASKVLKTIHQIPLNDLVSEKTPEFYNCKILENSFTCNNLTLVKIFISFSSDSNVLFPLKLLGYTPASMNTYHGESFERAFKRLIEYIDENNIPVTCVPDFNSMVTSLKVNNISIETGFANIMFESDSYESKKMVLLEGSDEFTVEEFLSIYPCIDDDETDWDGMSGKEIVESNSEKIFEQMKREFNILTIEKSDNASVDTSNSKTSIAKKESSLPNKNIYDKLKKVNKLGSLPTKLGTSISPQITATTPSDSSESGSVTSESKISKFKTAMASKRFKESTSSPAREAGAKLTSGGKISAKVSLFNKQNNLNETEKSSGSTVKNSIASKLSISNLASKAKSKQTTTPAKSLSKKLPLGKKTVIVDDSDEEDDDDDDDDSENKRRIVVGFDQAADESDNEDNNLFGNDDSSSDEESDEEEDEDFDEEEVINIEGLDI